MGPGVLKGSLLHFRFYTFVPYMRFNKSSDILLNIILPLLLGLLIYGAVEFINIPDVIRNYLPDGLWAYAFISCILVIWGREINRVWIALIFLFSVCFELLQYHHVIPGTGDIGDVSVYFIFFGIALRFNPIFKNLLSTQNR